MRSFNVDQQFAEIQKAATDAAKEVFPIKGRVRTINMKDVWVEDNQGSSDYAAQAKVKSREGTYGVPVYAHLQLIENASGKVIDTHKKLRLFLLHN